MTTPENKSDTVLNLSAPPSSGDCGQECDRTRASAVCWDFGDVDWQADQNTRGNQAEGGAKSPKHSAHRTLRRQRLPCSQNEADSGVLAEPYALALTHKHGQETMHNLPFFLT